MGTDVFALITDWEPSVAMYVQRDWMAEPSATGRGIVVVISSD